MKRHLLLAAMTLAAVVAGAREFRQADPTTLTMAEPLSTVRTSTASSSADGGDDRFTFSYCGEINNAMFVQPDYQNVAVAIGLDAATTTNFAGAKITKILIASGRNSPNLPVEYFLSNSLDEFGELTLVELTAADDQWNEFTLAEPVTIEGGTELFAGYVTPNDTTLYKFPISFDSTPNPHQYAFLYALPYGDFWMWQSVSSYAGSAGVKLVIEGDRLPHNECVLSVTTPEYTDPSTPLDIRMSLVNVCIEPVTSVEVEYCVGNLAAEKVTVDCDLPKYYDQTSLTVTIPKVEEGINVPVNVDLLKVNGSDVSPSAATSSHAVTNCFSPSAGSERMVVCEEQTSANDGFGPMSIVGMHNLLSVNPGGSVAGVSIHYDDAMAVNGVPTYWGVSAAKFNRLPSIGDVYPDDGGYQTAYEMARALPSFANMSLSVSADSDTPKTLTFTTTIDFAAAADGSDFAMSYVVTENGVGPYMQTNYYSDYIAGYLEGWTELGLSVETLFDNVALGYDTYQGIDGLFPAAVEAGKPVVIERTVVVDNISNRDNCSFLAMLVNKKTGVIEQAAATTEIGVLSADMVAGESDIEVLAAEGLIKVTGVGEVGVFTSDGRRVATLSDGQSAAVAPGIYIVRSAVGSKKLIVK